MNGKVATSCLLFLLSDWSHAAESNLRGGGSTSLVVPEPEQFRFAGGQINPLTLPTFQTDTTPFSPNPTKGSQFRPDGKTTDPTFVFQFPTDVAVTTTSPSIPVAAPFQLDPTKLSQLGSPYLDTETAFDDGNVIGGLGLGGLLVGGRDSCAKGPVGIPCTREYAPLSCGECVYNNSCLAEAAGFSKGQCKPVP
jgi:hypothetical protein